MNPMFFSVVVSPSPPPSLTIIVKQIQSRSTRPLSPLKKEKTTLNYIHPDERYFYFSRAGIAGWTNVFEECGPDPRKIYCCTVYFEEVSKRPFFASLNPQQLRGM